MKRLHRKDLYMWSVFDERLDIDFNGFAWVREGGNVLVDPLPMTPHDRAHLEKLGGAAWIVVTNSAHTRGAKAAAEAFGAKIAGPAKERETLELSCERWLSEGDSLVPGLTVVELDGSKTPGELALVLDGTTLVCGDLVRSHRAGALALLPDPKLTDKARAVASVRRLAGLPGISAVLVGDGWCAVREGKTVLEELAASL
jgi:hypothetical protein